jgi:alpha-glucosidase
VVEAPLERVPLFVRAGSVIPMERSDAETPSLRLHVFPAEASEGGGVMYSDAGDGYGPHRIDRYATTRAANGLSLRWTDEGDYPFPYADVEVHVHGMTIRRAVVDGRDVAPEGNRVRTGRFTDAFFEG